MEISKLFNENNLLFSTICQLRAASCNCSQNAMLCGCVREGKCQLCYGSGKNITQMPVRRGSGCQQRSSKILLYIRVLRGACIRSVLVCLVADITLKIAAGLVDVRAQRATRPSIRSPIARRNVAEQVQIGVGRADMRSTIHALHRAAALNKKCSGAPTNFASAASCLVRQTQRTGRKSKTRADKHAATGARAVA
jgi:hypothetical protein